MATTLQDTLKRLNLKPEPTVLTASDKARLTAAGALWNTADEGAALIRSMFSDETFDEAVADERKQLKEARKKDGSLKYEMGGGIIPGILAAPYTGGASLAPTLGRVAVLSGLDALVSSLGEREGDIIDRVTTDPVGLTLNTAVGTVAGTAGKKLIDATGSLIKKSPDVAGPVSRKIRGRISKEAEDEIRRIADASGISYKDIVERIRKGEIFPDMNPQAALDTAAMRGTATGRGGEIIQNAIDTRASTFPSAIRDKVLDDLAPNKILGNITKWFTKSRNARKAAESASYDKIFAKTKDTIFPNLNPAINEILEIVPDLQKPVIKILKAQKKPPLFKIVKVEGQDEKVVEMVGNVNLEVSEIVRRALYDKVGKAYKDGEGTLAKVYEEAEDNLRKIIDSSSDDIASTRAGWRKVKLMTETFEDGQKVLKSSAEDAEILMDKILASGDDEVIESFLAGIAVRLKSMTGKQRGLNTTVSELADEKNPMSKILERMYPESSYEDAFKKLKLADQALKTKASVVGGSPTQPRTGAAAKIGSGSGIASTVGSLVTGDVFTPALRLAGRYVANSLEGSGLTPKQFEEISRVLVTENPDLMQKALSSPALEVFVEKRIKSIANRLGMGAASASAYEASTSMENNPALNDITRGITKSVKAKILATQ